MDHETPINHSQYAQGVNDAIKAFEKHDEDIGRVIDEYDDSISLSYSLGYLTTVQNKIDKIIEQTKEDIITFNEEENEDERELGEDDRDGADSTDTAAEE